MKYVKLSMLISMLVIGSISEAICRIPDDLEKPITNQSRFECLKGAYFLQEPKWNIDLFQAANGPTLEKEVTFKSSDIVYCRYFYRYQNGSSNKFRCYRTDAQNRLMNTKGDVVVSAVAVGAFGTEREDQLLDSNGNVIVNKKGKPMEADVLKVRFQDGSKRHRENYTSTAASRMAWIMGIPAEHYYSVTKVTCFGCEKDPWKDGKNPQLKPIKDMQSDFMFASIERKNEAKRVIKAYSSPDKKIDINPWKWDEFYKYYDQLTQEQRLGFEVVAQFANFMQTVENRGSQHMVLCEDQYYDKVNKTCARPMAATHDLGSAFGSRYKSLIDPDTKNHPRGDFEAYRQTAMFKPGGACELMSVPGGMTEVTESARMEFVKRLDLLTPAVIKEILKSAHFQYTDLIFLKRVQQTEKLQGEVLNDRVLDLWTQVILSKINEFKNARCKKP